MSNKPQEPTMRGTHVPQRPIDDDPEEFTGSTQTNLADPKTIVPKSVAPSDPVPVVKAAAPAGPASPAVPPTNFDDAVIARDRAQAEYERIGRECQALAAQERLAETAMQNARRALVAHEPKVTATDLARDFSRTEQTKRAAQANGEPMRGPAPIVPGPSALDRSRATHAYESGDGRSFVQKQMRHGQRRGAYDSRYFGATLPKEPAA